MLSTKIIWNIYRWVKEFEKLIDLIFNDDYYYKYTLIFTTSVALLNLFTTSVSPQDYLLQYTIFSFLSITLQKQFYVINGKVLMKDVHKIMIMYISF